LGAEFRTTHKLVNWITVFTVLFCKLDPAICFLVVLWFQKPLLQVSIETVFEALRDVDKGRGVKEGSQRLQVVLLHIRKPEITMTCHLAHTSVLGR